MRAGTWDGLMGMGWGCCMHLHIILGMVIKITCCTIAKDYCKVLEDTISLNCILNNYGLIHQYIGQLWKERAKKVNH